MFCCVNIPIGDPDAALYRPVNGFIVVAVVSDGKTAATAAATNDDGDSR